MKPLLLYRAGPRALRTIRREGLRPRHVDAIAGSASGPRWLALAGLDRALVAAGYTSAARLLVGASAGAWRVLSMACRDANGAHGRLVRGYVHQVFPRGVTPAEVSASYARMLRDCFPDDEIQHILTRPGRDVAVHVTRLRGPWPWRARAVQTATMVAAAASHAVSRHGTRAWFERVLVHSNPDRFTTEFAGAVRPLTGENFLRAALASGTVPTYMEPVREIACVPRGAYVDGGLTDYHLRQGFAGDDRITLFPHFQREIAAVWFDRYAPWRGPSPAALSDVLQVYPSSAYVETLPGGRVPDRDDFVGFVDRPGERIRRWQECVARSERLGEAFLDDLENGRIEANVQPLGTFPHP